MNKLYVYRNSTVECQFKDLDVKFSYYDDINIIDTERDIMIFYMLPYCHVKEDLIAYVDEYKKRVKYIVSNYKNNKIYAVTLYNYFYNSLIIGDNTVNSKINEYNTFLYENKSINVIDLSLFYRKNSDVFDLKYYYLYNAIINPKLSSNFKNFIIDMIDSINSVRKKCLVLDLDNTLWGGILGEDGISNLKISGFYPGNCYNSFQKLILELKRQGVILCLCSKNNYADVEECFNQRSDMVLSLDDFTVKKINWNNKREEIVNISKELNIGLDSIVFIDDSPVERENVKSLTGVTVLDFPEFPYLMCDYFNDEFKKHFGTYSLTQEDIDKTKQYNYKVQSDILRESILSEEDFIKGLNIKIIYDELNDYNIDRIEQLINKSNQFNLTTKRYTKLDLLNMDHTIISSIKIIDKFGDLGLTGVAIVKLEDKIAYIDSFLLSCRILGRKIENEFLKIIINRLYKLGVYEVIGEYIVSPKNSQVNDFYKNNGFVEIEKTYDKTIYKYIINDIIDYDNNYIVEVSNE